MPFTGFAIGIATLSPEIADMVADMVEVESELRFLAAVLTRSSGRPSPVGLSVGEPHAATSFKQRKQGLRSYSA